jgi:hypothetical protein
VIEQIFGVLKQCFHILLIAPEYNLDIQAQISVALCILHNFIHTHDSDEGLLAEVSDFFNDNSGFGNARDFSATTVAEVQTEVSI